MDRADVASGRRAPGSDERHLCVGSLPAASRSRWLPTAGIRGLLRLSGVPDQPDHHACGRWPSPDAGELVGGVQLARECVRLPCRLLSRGMRLNDALGVSVELDRGLPPPFDLRANPCGPGCLCGVPHAPGARGADGAPRLLRVLCGGGGQGSW